ncbi:MAG: hypothetical protein ACREFR_07090 [Limisphaerales bacterium]
MSWDIFVSNFPAEAKTVDDVPHDFVGKPIGTRHDIIIRIREIIPTAIFPDKSWGQIAGPGVEVEVRLGDHEIVRDFAFHIRGSEASAACVADILRHLNLRAVDAESGEFFDMNRAADGIQKWKECREQILSKSAK